MKKKLTLNAFLRFWRMKKGDPEIAFGLDLCKDGDTVTTMGF